MALVIGAGLPAARATGSGALRGAPGESSTARAIGSSGPWPAGVVGRDASTGGFVAGDPTARSTGSGASCPTGGTGLADAEDSCATEASAAGSVDLCTSGAPEDAAAGADRWATGSVEGSFACVARTPGSSATGSAGVSAVRDTVTLGSCAVEATGSAGGPGNGMETLVEPPGVPGGSVASNGRKLFTGGDPVVRDAGAGGAPGASARRDTGSPPPAGAGSIGAPSPSRRGVACSGRWTSGSSGSGADGAGEGVTEGSSKDPVKGAANASAGLLEAAGVSTGDGSAIAWRVRTGGVSTLPADVSRGTTSGLPTTGSASGSSGDSGATTRCTGGPPTVAGRSRSPITPAGSAGPTRCPRGSR